MKKYIQNSDNVLKLDIDVIFARYQDNIAATTITPIIDINSDEVNDQAKADFGSFVSNLFETIEYYDFEILDDFKHTSNSFPNTSEYRWIARRDELEANDVPKYIHLRVSDHYQEFSPEGKRRLKNKLNREAEQLKKPSTKKKQRFVEEEIVVNETTHTTYEEALAYSEKLIFKWLESRGVDMSEYDVLGW